MGSEKEPRDKNQETRLKKGRKYSCICLPAGRFVAKKKRSTKLIKKNIEYRKEMKNLSWKSGDRIDE